MSNNFSIIIPVYNTERYLRQCLESVINQIDEEDEVVLIDDGSTDGSSEIYKTYLSNKQIKLIKKENSGLSDSRNIGVDIAANDYVLFLDSDDFLEENCIEELKSHVSIHYKNVYITPLTNYINGNKSTNFISAETADEFVVSKYEKTPAQRYIVKRSFLKALGLQFPIGRLHEDVYWCNILCDSVTNGDAEIINLSWYNYRRDSEGSIMNKQGFKHIKDTFEIVEQLQCLLKNISLIKGLTPVLYSKLRLYYSATPNEKKWIEAFIDKNILMFNGTAKRYKLFYRFAKVLGAKSALKIAKRFVV